MGKVLNQSTKEQRELEKWVRKIGREESLKVLKEYRKELASLPSCGVINP